MVPARDLLGRQYDGCSGRFYYKTHLDYCEEVSSITTGFMAEEDTRTGGNGGGGDGGGAGSSKGDDDGEEGDVGTSDSARCVVGGASTAGGDEGWLQLGIGSSKRSPPTSKAGSSDRPVALQDLDLFSVGPMESRMRALPPMGPMGMRATSTAATVMLPLLPTYGSYSMRSWGMWNVGAPSSSTKPMMAPSPYDTRQLMYVPGSGNLGFPAAEGSRSTPEVRVVSPPSQPRNGLWFSLQASQNQVKEPFLPQIPKSYLRIKDGRMTVHLVMKYLVNKLGLDNESEVEITCRWQHLPPHMTLQHVRDHIWCWGDIDEVSPESVIDNVMTLQYSRSTSMI